MSASVIRHRTRRRRAGGIDAMGAARGHAATDEERRRRWAHDPRAGVASGAAGRRRAPSLDRGVRAIPSTDGGREPHELPAGSQKGGPSRAQRQRPGAPRGRADGLFPCLNMRPGPYVPCAPCLAPPLKCSQGLHDATWFSVLLAVAPDFWVLSSLQKLGCLPLVRWSHGRILLSDYARRPTWPQVP